MRRDTNVGNVALSSGPLANAVSTIVSILRAILRDTYMAYRRLGLNAGLSAAGSSEATESFLRKIQWSMYVHIKPLSSSAYLV